MSFRSLTTILREASGAYVSGIWVPGARSVITQFLSAQPVAIGAGRDMIALPEGRHFADYLKFYTDTKLRVTADAEGVQPDIVVIGGYGYELIDEAPHQSNVINHYKYIGHKVLKFTTSSDWTSGILKRP